MKLKAWIAAGMFSVISVIIVACGEVRREAQDEDEISTTPEIKELTDEVEVLAVKGNAAFGSRCQDGSIAAPQPVPLEFYNKCKAKLDYAELVENLPSFTLQADCKRRILDIQRRDRSTLTSWEFKANGEFEIFGIDAGTGKLKSDGAGGESCNVPMVANFSGHVDCTDAFKPKIYLDTAWFLDQTVEEPAVLPSTVPSASSPSSRPSSAPSAVPSSAPAPTSSSAPQPGPNRAPRTGVSHSVGVPSIVNRCNLPPGCYFFNETRIDQCS